MSHDYARITEDRRKYNGNLVAGKTGKKKIAAVENQESIPARIGIYNSEKRAPTVVSVFSFSFTSAAAAKYTESEFAGGNQGMSDRDR